MENNQLDILSLLYKANETLSMQSLDEAIPFEIGYLSQAMDFARSLKAPFVSYVFFFNKNLNRYYPLFFFENTESFNHYPIYNKYAIRVLGEIGILIDESASLTENLRQILNFLEQRSLKSKFDLMYSVQPITYEAIQFNHIYAFLNEYVEDKPLEEKYDGLFRFVRNQSFEETNLDNDTTLFGKQNSVFRKLEKYSSTKVSVQGEDMMEDMVNRILDYSINEKYNILFLTSKEEKESFYNRQFHKNNLDSYVLDCKSFLIGETLEKQGGDFKDYDYFLTLEKRLESFVAKKKECFVYPEFLLQPETMDILFTLQRDPELLEFDEYTQEDFEKDRRFLDFLDGEETLKKTYIRNSEAFGLTGSGDIDDYQVMITLISTIKENIRNLKKQISTCQFFKDYSLVIETPAQLSSMIKDMDVLSGYNGFPRKYFRIDQEESEKQDLDSLKKLYQKLSSSKLMISQLFNKEFFDNEKIIREQLNLYENGKFFEKSAAKKKIISYRKNSSEKKIDVLIQLIRIYFEAEDTIERVLPGYVELYGENVSNMNGVVEIQSNVRYIRSFKERGKENPEFNVENPYIKKALKDKDFRNYIISSVHELKLAYDKINETLTKYKKYIVSDQRETQSLTFDEMISYFDYKSSLDYQEYSAYLKGKQLFDQSSMLLKVIVRQQEIRKISFTDFKPWFITSLIYTFYEKAKLRFEPYEKSYQQYLQEFTFLMHDNSKGEEFERKERLSQKVSELTENSTFDEEADRIAEIYENGNLTLKDYCNFYRLGMELHPFSLSDQESLSVVPDSIYDVVVIVDSTALNNLELLNAYRAGKRIIILNSDKITDSRLLGYHDSLLTRKNLYDRMFDFTKLSDQEMKYLRNTILNAKLEIANEFNYPFVVRNGEKKYALLPVSTIKDKDDLDEHSQFRRFLLSQEGLQLIIFDYLDFIFDESSLLCLLK